MGARLFDNGQMDEGRAFAYYGNGGAGLSLRPRQARGDDTALMQLLGKSSGATDMRARLFGRTPMGRTRARLQVEVKALGTAFNGAGLTNGDWTDIGTAGVEMEQPVENLTAGTMHHWRARLQYFPYMAYGPWFSIGPNGAQEDDFRTAGAGPAVTIDQAAAQADPTGASPINFTVVFSESVTGFATGDVTLGGTAGATTGTVSGSGTTYNVAVSGMIADGTVIATIAADVAADAAGNLNVTSTSTDNTVTYDVAGPGSTILTNEFYNAVTYPGFIDGTAVDNCGTGLAVVEVAIQNSAGDYWDGAAWVVGPVWLTAVGTAAWTYAFAPTDGETYDLQSRATDNTGTVQSVPATASFTYDATEPGSTVTTSGPYTSATWFGTIDGTAFDATSGINIVEITIERFSDGLFWDGVTWTAAPAWLPAAGTIVWSYPFAPASGETYGLESRAGDVAGNVQSVPATSTFSYSLVGPDSTVTTSGPYGPATYPGPIEGTATAGAVLVEITIQRIDDGLYWNGAAWGPPAAWLATGGTTAWSYAFGPAEGDTYEVRTRATDGAGVVETTYGVATFSFDATPPTVDVITEGTFAPAEWPGPIRGTAADEFSGLAAVGFTLMRWSDGLFWDGAGWGVAPTWITPSGLSNWARTFDPAGAEGYEISARSTDLAGNESTTAVGSFDVLDAKPEPEDGSRGQHGGGCSFLFFAQRGPAVEPVWAVFGILLLWMARIRGSRRSTST